MTTDNKDLAKAVRDLAKAHGESLSKLTEAVNSVAYALRQLGNADAATPMGAIEAFGGVVQEGLSSVASAINEVASNMPRPD